MKEFRDFIYNEHDVVCNQKYADTLPYSTHLGFVEAQGKKFRHLIEDEWVKNPGNFRSVDISLWEVVKHALIAHDSMEDARMTYNDVVKACGTLGNYKAAIMVADIVYCVTDEKGKTRKDRKNDKYYEELKQNKLAIFVKLSDLAANTLFSKLSGSSMYEKYKKEWPNFKKKLYIAEYDEFFNYIENI